ncbi:MAG TPA: sigma-70 family RNA polymerase sigma factor, partial [Polyangiales bacterium]|nr:sigma-70 family RNA polymerase sigma factor [Polyangiales bacterium]
LLLGAGLAAVVATQLAARIAAGDPSALRSAYNEYAGRVLALSLRIVRSKAEAEDVVQDTFLEVWRRASEFDGSRGELSSWIMAMARSRAIDRVRRARVRARYAETPQQEPQPSTPDEQAAQHQDGAKLRGVLDTLPPEQKSALELAYFDGLTQQQIAERTGLPLGTVKTRLRLALEKLSTQLEALR